MTMSWSDAVTESTLKPTRQPRPSYVPPHLRHSGSSYGYGSSTESAQYGFRSSYTGPGRQPGRTGTARGGRGRGRGGRFWAQQPQNPSPDLNPSDNVSEKFDQLKVTEEDSNGGINFDAYEDIPVEASGADIPPPVDTFHEIDLGECLNHNIKTRCKYVKPTPIQRHAIPVVMAGRDLMACAQTGSGKTAAFCLPIISGVLNNNSLGRSPTRGGAHTVCPTALILSPTRELAGQVMCFLASGDFYCFCANGCLSNFVLYLLFFFFAFEFFWVDT